MNLFDYDNRTFYIDIDKLMSWISETPSKQRNIETTIVQVYSDVENMEDSSKEITETKNSLNETLNSFKYDLMRNFINIIISPIVTSDGEYTTIQNDGTLTFGQTIAFNTLLHNGIIVEITE